MGHTSPAHSIPAIRSAHTLFCFSGIRILSAPSIKMSTKSQTLDHISNADQKNDSSNNDNNNAERHAEGKENSHQNLDAKDEKSIKNKLAQAAEEEKREKKEAEENDEMPTDAARKNGNEPSRGAKIDEQIELEEQAELAKKEAKKKGN